MSRRCSAPIVALLALLAVVLGAAPVAAETADPAPSVDQMPNVDEVDGGDGDEVVPYIVGGTAAPTDAWPSMVALVSEGPSGLSQYCGGTLVREDLVVTAAHCAEADDYHLDPTGLSVLAGRTNLSSSGGDLIPVERVTIHPNWNRANLHADLALLHLSHPASAEVAVLADARTEPYWPWAPSATIVGWGGTTGPGTGSSTLLERDVEVLSDDECTKTFPSSSPGSYQAGLDLCAGGVGFGTCHGDSGGPLFADGPTSPDLLAGVISRGFSQCGTGPGVMTRIAAYSEWIYTTTMSTSTTRLSGTDRYATAAQLAARVPAGTDTVYLVSGEQFPDAVAAAAIAGADGAPVLLTTRDALPDATRDQLVRLDPGRLVVVGGSAAVSEAVATAAADAAGVPAERVHGTDRYATSAALSSDAYPDGATTAYVVAGTGFADAVASGPVAGRPDGGPMLLTETGDLPFTVATELARLDPDRIVVLGGTAAVGTSVENELREIAPVSRIRGSDRYATAAALSADTFAPGVDVVYVATGQAFPDALAVAPVAVEDDAPVLLVDGGRIPDAAAAEIERLAPSRVVVLGGRAAVPTAGMWRLDGLL